MTRRPLTAIRRRIDLVLHFALAGIGVTMTASAADTVPKLSTPSSADLVRQASQDFANDKVDAAMREVSLALELDPRNLSAYELRSSIYVRQKLWTRAESDITDADKIQPDVAYKYKLGEIKFLQKDFGDARPRFAALRDDPRLGDLATYKVILCDLFGGQQKTAERDLAALDSSNKKPSYYFAHAAWFLFHDQRPEANKWFEQAQGLYDSSILNLYVGSLVEAQRLRLPTANFITRDGRRFVHARISLEAAGLRAAIRNGWVTLPLDQLPDELSSFPEDIRDQITRRRGIAKNQLAATSTITFTTTTGQSYKQVRWSLQDSGVAVVTNNGWVTVPFNQLPNDLTAFPPDARKTILSKRESPPSRVKQTAMISFTTKQGKTYADVETSMSRNGLTVLTTNGRMTIPFRDLPDDLSAFPMAWKRPIETGRVTDDSSNAQHLSFTTRDGKQYDDVRASLDANALRVLTAQGLIGVPFDNLSDDLSPFPVAWREKIAAQRKNGSNSPPLDANAELPPRARDCNFGSCVALSGSIMVIGSRGAAYVYDDSRLEARLCPDPDSTGTGDAVASVAISHHTIVTATQRGVYIWVPTNSGWELEDHLVLPGASTVSIDGDNLLVIVDGKGDAANSVSYYARQGDAWLPVPNSSQHDKDTLSADRYGCGGALSGGISLIGIPDWSSASYLKGKAATSGQACIERFDGTGWTESALLTPDGLPSGANQFGASVALSAHLAAISSGNHDTIDSTQHHGTVCLFRRTAGDWQQDAELKSPASDGDSGFGCGPIALSQQTLAVGDCGVRLHSDNVMLDTGEKTQKPGWIQNAGAVYIFDGKNPQATLTAPDPMDGLDRHGSHDHFAASIALDGDMLLVGAPGKIGGTGVVYIWTREKGRWQLKNELAGFHKQLDFDY